MQSLSFLETYDRSDLPWVISGGQLYVGRDTLPAATQLGDIRIGLEKKGAVAAIEKQHIASRRHLLHGEAVERVATTFTDKVISSYKKQISFEEEGARKRWLSLSVAKYKGPCHLDEILQGIGPSDVYLGVRGRAYGLREGQGSFRFGNKEYDIQDIGSSEKIRTLHELAIRKQVKNSSERVGVESQVLSSLNLHVQGSSVTATVSLEPYAMRTPLGIYCFDACDIQYGFLVRGQSASFTKVPQVLKPAPYEHPFVFSDNRICFDGTKRWDDEGISPNTRIGREGIEQKIAFVAAETARMMRGSYTKKTRPANGLLNMPGRKVTENQAVSRGVVVYGRK